MGKKKDGHNDHDYYKSTTCVSCTVKYQKTNDTENCREPWEGTKTETSKKCISDWNHCVWGKHNETKWQICTKARDSNHSTIRTSK